MESRCALPMFGSRHGQRQSIWILWLGASEPNLGTHQLSRLEMKFSDITLFAGTVSVVVIAALALYTLIVSFPITPAF